MTEQAATRIRKARWAIVWDAAREGHAFANDVDIVFSGNTIRHVGAGYEGPVGTEIDGAGLLVMPGLVDIHAHPALEPMNRGLTDDVASPHLYNTALYEFNPAFRPDPEGTEAAVQLAAGEALKSGVTTLVDIGIAHQPCADALIATGLRVVLAPGFRAARWRMPNSHSVEYDWDDAAAGRMYEAAIAHIERNARHPGGRVSGMLAPMQIDTVRPDMIQASHAYARENGLPWQIHAGQSLVEFLEMTRRHGLTPVQWLESLGVLDRHSIVGHAIFLDHHRMTNWPTRRDLPLLAESGASVAHCPTVFGRRGVMLDHFGEYLRAGINMSIGTDTHPHNMIEEIRHAAYFGRASAGSVHALSTADVFTAATAGGAAALGRTDIGRIAAGAKADIVLVDLDFMSMHPLRDPLRNLIFSAADRAVRDVYVDGRQLVRNGVVETIDLPRVAALVDEAQRRAMATAPKMDRLGRSAGQMVPLLLPMMADGQLKETDR